MSETNTGIHRTRRRAVRSAGPPSEDGGAPTESSVSADTESGTAAATTASAAALGASVNTTVTDASAAAADRVERPAAAAAPSTDATQDVAAKSADAEVPAGVEGTTEPDEHRPVDLDKALPQAEHDSLVREEAAAHTTQLRGRARILAIAAFAVVVLALVVGAGISVVALRSADGRDERRIEYVQTARQVILNLTTIRADSAKEDIDRILAVASGEFKTEFDGRVDPFTSIVQQAKVVSNGEIVEAAVESDGEKSARVLVAAKQTLTNAGQAEPQTRFYRFRVTVNRGDSGLTVSDVEFVA